MTGFEISSYAPGLSGHPLASRGYPYLSSPEGPRLEGESGTPVDEVNR